MILDDLKQYRDLVNETKHLKEELMRLESRSYSPRMSELSDTPKGPISEVDQMTGKAYKLDRLRKKYKAMVQEGEEKLLYLEELVKKLEPFERDLIRYRYFDGLKWSKVFKEIGYSQKQTFRIHGKIIRKMEKMTHYDT